MTIPDYQARVMARAVASKYYAGEGTVKEILAPKNLTPDEQMQVIEYIVAFYPDIPVYDPYE
ncbi:hypothetical protein D3C76_1377030 [compost metagenome]